MQSKIVTEGTRLLTVEEAAQRCGREPAVLRRWVREGKLASRRVGRRYLIDEDDLKELGTTSEMADLPPAWQTMSDGQPMLDWVAYVRRGRDRH